MNPPIPESALPESIRKIIDRAKNELRPLKILLYGSRARNTNAVSSDFDLAFVGVEEGPAWTRFFNFVQHDAPTAFGIDLIRLEAASDTLRESIEREGREVL